MAKKIKRILFAVVLGLMIIMLLPFGKLILTEEDVAKSLIFDIYFVKVTANQNDIEVFIDYMNRAGWNKVDQLGGVHIFEKNGLKKQVTNTQVKTFLVDGKLNLDYLKRIIR